MIPTENSSFEVFMSYELFGLGGLFYQVLDNRSGVSRKAEETKLKHQICG